MARNRDNGDRRIAELAARQHGLITRAQLRELGLGDGAIEHRLRTGHLHGARRSVYAVGHPALTPDGRLLAAVWAYGGEAVLSHVTAAGVWGLRPRSGTLVDVMVPTTAGRRAIEGVRLHRCRDLRPDERTAFDGLPVTTVARTLLDLAAVVPAHHLRRAVERAEQLELFDLRDVQRMLRAHPARPGWPALVALLDDARRHGLPATRSDLEAAMLQVCLDHRLPRPVVNARLGGPEVDFVWSAARLRVETDGYATHGTRAAFAEDRRRDREATLDGWRVLRFTYWEVLSEPTMVAATIREALAV